MVMITVISITIIIMITIIMITMMTKSMTILKMRIKIKLIILLFAPTVILPSKCFGGLKSNVSIRLNRSYLCFNFDLFVFSAM